MVYGRQVLDDSDLLKALEASVRSGEQAKVASRLSMRMLIRDDEEALILITTPEGARVGS